MERRASELESASTRAQLASEQLFRASGTVGQCLKPTRSGARTGMSARRDAILVLEDGTVFSGEAYGSVGETFGEAGFTTGLTGYQETLTVPSDHPPDVGPTAPPT